MKLNKLMVFLLAGCVLSFMPMAQCAENPAQSTVSETQSSPVAFVPEESFEFAPSAEGLEVTHNFIVKNRGNGPLKIENVKTG
jgi:hypothetical protein